MRLNTLCASLCGLLKIGAPEVTLTLEQRMRTCHNWTEFRAASMASYTKEKLKSILINHNVAIPKDARKEVYLDLYRTHVESMKKSEFSSDDESISRSPTKRNKVCAAAAGRRSCLLLAIWG